MPPRPRTFPLVLLLALAAACDRSRLSDDTGPAPEADADADADTDTDTDWDPDDADHDGWTPDEGDCDDSEPSIHPRAAEICNDGIDQDCDGTASPCGVFVSGDLADSPTAFTGRRDLGFSLAAVDLDGDGFDAIAAGTAGLSGRGAVYLLPGTARGVLSASLAEAIIEGVENGSGTGWAIGGGDLDGDGQDDLAVGEPWLWGSRGTVSLVHGPVTGSPSLEDAEATLLGDAGPSGFGYAIAVGDPDGDGAQDLLIGAPWEQDAAGGSLGGARRTRWHLVRRRHRHRPHRRARE